MLMHTRPRSTLWGTAHNSVQKNLFCWRARGILCTRKMPTARTKKTKTRILSATNTVNKKRLRGHERSLPQQCRSRTLPRHHHPPDAMLGQRPALLFWRPFSGNLSRERRSESERLFGKQKDMERASTACRNKVKDKSGLPSPPSQPENHWTKSCFARQSPFSVAKNKVTCRRTTGKPDEPEIDRRNEKDPLMGDGNDPL